MFAYAAANQRNTWFTGAEHINNASAYDEIRIALYADN